jgi:natural product precursor
MKKLRRLKLNQLSKKELANREMKQLTGKGAGDPCGCACAYADTGGSHVAVNMAANSQTGSTSNYGTPTDWITYDCTYYWSDGHFYFFGNEYGYSASGTPPL